MSERCNKELTESKDLEQIITSHARLPGHASGDDDDIRSLQSLTQLLLSSIALSSIIIIWMATLSESMHGLTSSNHAILRACQESMWPCTP